MIPHCNLVAFFALLLFHFSRTAAQAAFLDFCDDFGGIPEDASDAACQSNTDLLSRVLQQNVSGNVIRIAAADRTFHFYNGIYAIHLQNAVLIVDGTMRFERKGGPLMAAATNESKAQGARPEPLFMLDKSRNITLTSTLSSSSSDSSSSSSKRGLIDGRGSDYWGIPGIGYLEIGEHRPRMLRVNLTTDLLIENLIFQDSPYHTVYLEAVKNVTIRHVSIVARRTGEDGHNWIDLSAFNTDGIDVSGSDVHIHDVDIWTQDDCIAVKDNVFPPYESANMLIERVNCSGLGFVVGSIGGSTVRNITFRDSYLHRSVKGLYLKFHTRGSFWIERNRTGLVTDVTFENITMEQPLQWPLWIGPAQQSDTRNPCLAHPCSLCWPQDPMATCHPVADAEYRNLTLRNIRINNPKMSPGVVLGGGSETHNMINGILFDNVRVTQGPPVPQSLVDRVISFPGLKQPIVDRYVPFTEREWTVMRDVKDVVTGALRDAQGNPVLDVYLYEDSVNDDGFWISTASLSPEALLAVMAGCYFFLHVFLLAAFYGFAAARKQKHHAVTSSEHDSKDSAHGATSAYERVPFSSPDPTVHSAAESTPTRSSRRVRIVAIILLFELVLLGTLYNVVIVQLPWGKPKWNRINSYFRCAGVANGIATGGTWPVPSCFTEVQNAVPKVLLNDVTVARHNTLGIWNWESTAALTTSGFACLALFTILATNYRARQHKTKLKERALEAAAGDAKCCHDIVHVD